MQYSCGYFTDWNNSLEQAQRDKLEMICRKLRLQPGERLLDIGCGWGGLICYAAAQYGVVAHGVTLSQTQHDFAQEKVRRLGLADRVTVELRDYTTRLANDEELRARMATAAQLRAQRFTPEGFMTNFTRLVPVA